MTTEEFRDQTAIQICAALVTEAVRHRRTFWGAMLSFESFKEALDSAPGVAWEIACLAAKEREQCLAQEK